MPLGSCRREDLDLHPEIHNHLKIHLPVGLAHHPRALETPALDLRLLTFARDLADLLKMRKQKLCGSRLSSRSIAPMKMDDGMRSLRWMLVIVMKMFRIVIVSTVLNLGLIKRQVRSSSLEC